MEHPAGQPLVDSPASNGRDTGTRRRPGADRRRSDDERAETATMTASERSGRLEEPRKKSVIIAYLLYLLFGWTGAHLFYLGRDFHGFVSLTTFGRFGVGLFLDLFAIPTYVAQANEERDMVEDWNNFVRLSQSSRRCTCFSWQRLTTLLLQCCTGLTFVWLCPLAIPTDLPYYSLIRVGVVVTAAVLGIWLVGNIGIETVDFKRLWILALAVYTGLWLFEAEHPEKLLVYPMTLVACYLTSFRSRHDRSSRQQAKRKGACRRGLYISLGVFLFCGVWVGVILMNAEVQNEHGQKIKLYDALKNFYNSPAWEEMKDTFEKVREEAFKEDSSDEDPGFDSRWERFFSKMKDVFDVDGERRALMDLGLEEGASAKDIKMAHRKLAKKYHPDRNRGNEKEASAKFMKVQEAYETLQRLRHLRSQQNGNDGDDFDQW